MRDRSWLALTAVPFAVAALMPGSLLGAVGSPAGDEVTRFQDPEIVESSGLVVVDGLLVTSNDSGDTGRVFTVDPTTGETVGVTAWSSAPTDVEALAPAGDGSVWVGDIGDNRADRESVSITKVPVGRGPRDVDEASYELVYPDGARDAESLLADPATGRLYVISKGVFGGVLYAAPRQLSPDRPNKPRGGRADARGGDRRRVLPRRPAPDRPQLLPGGRLLVARSHRGRPLRAAAQQQGEGIAVAADGTIYASSEGLHAPVLRISLPPAVRQAMAPPSPTPSATPSPTPAPGNTVGKELPEEAAGERSVWGWALGGVLGLGIVVVLVRSLRPR